MSLFPKSISNATPTRTKSTTRGRNGFKLNNQVNPMPQTITATSHGLFLIIPNKGIPNNKHPNGDGLKLGNYIICISINKSSRLITIFRLRNSETSVSWAPIPGKGRTTYTTARLMIFANLGSNGTSNRWTPTKTMFVHSNNSKFCFGFEKTISGLPTNRGA